MNSNLIKDNNGSNNSTVLDKTAVKEIQSVVPKKRQELLKWYGWGYQDSYFAYDNGQIVFNGTRYPIGGGVSLPLFKDYVIKRLNIELDKKPQKPILPQSFPDPIICDDFLLKLKSYNFDHSIEGEDRLVRSHGQTLHDIYSLRHGGFKRIPDIVVWPKCHQDVVIVVELANQYDVVVIPYGGGTSVSGAASCPQNESRCMVVLDTSQMNRMLWLDKENLVGCFEAGIIGQDLENELKKVNLTVGHEPDSYEFSSLGGWVATRASGMKKNVYGNIEDIVVRVKMVTSKGTLERHISAPRVSSGPDFNHVILGSEGTLGVITEVQLKVRPLPEVRKYGSLVFPNFSTGVKFMREVAKRRCQPASIRLVDNEQFKMGQTMRPGKSLLTSCMEYIKTTYLTSIKRFDLDKLVVATLLFEGDAQSVTQQENLIEEIGKKFGGISAGAKNGEKGYMLTFVIAYIRDMALDYSVVAESFETSTSWDRCEFLCRNVRQTLDKECARHGIKHYVVSHRVTQTYDAGCCIYFYFGFNYSNLQDPVHTFEVIEGKARDEILASGGSISHHHGVGKIRSKWYPQTISNVGVNLFKAAKKELDPKNVFAVGNLVTNDAENNLIQENVKAKL